MANNSAKISLGTAICIFIIIVLVFALGIVYYLGFVKDTTVIENEIENNNEMDTVDVISTSDLVTLYYDANNEQANIFYAYIEDGYLYYFNDYATGNGVSEGTFDFTSSLITYSTNNNGMQKCTSLNNIKKMKTYNLGTGINPVQFLITENGEVYTINYCTSDDIEPTKYEALKNYEVEDILSYTGEMYSVFEILLKDGTTKTVTIGEEDM